MTRTTKARSSGLALLQAELNQQPPKARVRKTLIVDDGGPVTCQLSLARVDILAHQNGLRRESGSSLRELAAQVEQAHIGAFEPASAGPPVQPVPAAPAMPSVATPEAAPDAYPTAAPIVSPIEAPVATPVASPVETPVVSPAAPAAAPAPAPAVVPPVAPSGEAPQAVAAPVEPAPEGVDPLDAAVLAQDLAMLTSQPSAAAPSAASPTIKRPNSAVRAGSEGNTEDRHAVFDRIQQAREQGTYATGASTDVFDRIAANRAQATTFDLGSFSVQQRFDGFDRMLATEVAHSEEEQNLPPALQGPPAAVEEADLQDDLAQLRGRRPDAVPVQPAVAVPSPPAVSAAPAAPTVPTVPADAQTAIPETPEVSESPATSVTPEQAPKADTAEPNRACDAAGGATAPDSGDGNGTVPPIANDEESR